MKTQNIRKRKTAMGSRPKGNQVSSRGREILRIQAGFPNYKPSTITKRGDHRR